MLHKHKANLEARSANDETPLWISVQNSSSQTVSYLLQNKCDPNTSSRFTGNTLIHLACREHCQETARLLLSYGADMSTPNIAGATPLSFISGEVVGWLGSPTTAPDPVASPEDQRKIQSFMMCLFSIFCQTDDVEMVKELFSTTSFKLSSTPLQRRSPLSHALLTQSYGIAEYLIKNGAELVDLEVC